MNQHATWSLQTAVYERLINATSLTDALGGPFVYDRVPRQRKPPYVVLGDGETADWSTGSEGGQEHLLSFEIVSRQPGRKEVVELAGHLRIALDGADFPLIDHHLVNLRFGSASVRSNREDDGYTATVRFRAVTEPITT